MTIEQANAIAEFLENEGAEDVTVHEDYSGRGMYGKTVAGISGANPVWVGWAAGQLGLREDDLPRNQDSLGYDIIVY
tara:strand:- start:590 stop:820 length:231 start_codon:yes stop_codon:yes gene_type:complete